MVEAKAIATFLLAARNSGDQTTLRIMADYLEECGNPIAVLLRARYPPISSLYYGYGYSYGYGDGYGHGYGAGDGHGYGAGDGYGYSYGAGYGYGYGYGASYGYGYSYGAGDGYGYGYGAGHGYGYGYGAGYDDILHANITFYQMRLPVNDLQIGQAILVWPGGGVAWVGEYNGPCGLFGVMIKNPTMLCRTGGTPWDALCCGVGRERMICRRWPEPSPDGMPVPAFIAMGAWTGEVPQTTAEQGAESG